MSQNATDNVQLVIVTAVCVRLLDIYIMTVTKVFIM